ncbi:MAG: 30S ribosomal protein S6 [Candidatus Brocadiaceae bacterium]|nr:30S ribosomal protein S6 [Candidatus Brocadiaceae bacterium]
MAPNLYEAMFVVDAARGTSAVPDIVRHIAGLLTRHEAQIERIELWEERKLAYPIQKAKRGMYFLVYFQAEPDAIAQIRHTVRLSEQILRVLVLRAEQVVPPKGQMYTPEGEPVAAPEGAAAPVRAPEAAAGQDGSPSEDDEDDEDDSDDE